jgi:hypothetical protein
MRIATLLLFLSLTIACSGESESSNNEADAGGPDASSSQNADPTCDTPCPAGEYQEFGTCDDDSCVTRMACGEEVVCRDQTACLELATCSDGGLPMDACPPGSEGCLPYMVCGITKYCITLQQCAHDACDAAEVATSLACSDAAIDLPCREVTACGADTISCVCRAEELFCNEDENERLETTPCAGGQICREVMGCGATFYCKGGSI